MTLPIYLDDRWVGTHGIGRFAAEIASRSGFAKLGLSGHPLDVIDPWRLASFVKEIKPKHIFSPGINSPIRKICSFSITIHDLMLIDLPELITLPKYAYYQMV